MGECQIKRQFAVCVTPACRDPSVGIGGVVAELPFEGSGVVAVRPISAASEVEAILMFGGATSLSACGRPVLELWASEITASFLAALAPGFAVALAGDDAADRAHVARGDRVASTAGRASITAPAAADLIG